MARQLPLFSSPPTRDAVPAAQVKPFIKWAGGKSRLLKHILPHIPTNFHSYHEPFLGGGAVYFAIAARIDGHAYLADLNSDLVNAWNAVRYSPDELLEQLEFYRTNDSKEFYLEVRQVNPCSQLEKAARFIYLNQTSWNGLWRVNKWGQFNVPWGDRKFRGLSTDVVKSIHLVLQRATISEADFKTALGFVRPGDFVYLDPPYLPISDTSKFYLYNETRFRAPDLAELAHLCNQLSDMGTKWVMSNRDTETVRDLFDGHEFYAFTVNRAVAAQNLRDVETRDSPEIVVVGKERR